MTSMNRSAELARWELALDASLAGDVAVILVEGAVGCGKSTFVAAAAEDATARGAVVLRAAGTAREQTVPFGVLRQLAFSGPLDWLPDPGPLHSEQGDSVRFASALRQLSDSVTVVLCVDDAQYIDAPSLRCLLGIVRSAQTVSITLVFTTSVHGRGTDPHFATELMRHSNFSRIRLERLDRSAVRDMLDGGSTGDSDRMYEVSGGNPLLVRALLDDPGVEPEGPFAQAVLACLHSCGQATWELAEGLAVLDGQGTAALAGELLGVSTAAAQQAITALGAAGLIDGLRFRHPAVTAAVLDRMDTARRVDLHQRAAALCRRAGSPAHEIARHLLASGHAGAAWVLPVLRTAAGQFLSFGAVDQAVACLELAHGLCVDIAERGEIGVRLSQITAALSPAASDRHLAQVVVASRAGSLPDSVLRSLADGLIAQGRIDDAASCLERSAAADSGHWAADAPTVASTPARLAEQARTHAVAPWALPYGKEQDPALSSAEDLLRAVSVTSSTVEPALQAVRTLLYLGGPQRSLSWSRAFADRADDRGAPGWHAAFAGLTAQALLRQGDAAGARAEAAAVLDRFPHWYDSYQLSGIAGTLVHALTAMGRLEDAAVVLDCPVPEDLDDSMHGLAHRRARGLHALAVGHPHTAVEHFLEVGRIMTRWGLDRARALPWRTDAAEALLRLGDAEWARRLVTEQLGMPDAADPWVHGICLRVQAALCGVGARSALLRTAIDELSRSEDRYELALALAHYGRTLKELGDSARSTIVSRRAWTIAGECGAESLRRRILPGYSDDPAVPSRMFVAGLPKLSASEQRVATLAAHGDTNREIALKLYITVSTVEQHLTRIYRKLEIAGRQQLPSALRADVTALA
ncbi:LuxR C-terminal-related transcriptional regulator [Streptomyces canus]